MECKQVISVFCLFFLLGGWGCGSTMEKSETLADQKHLTEQNVNQHSEQELTAVTSNKLDYLWNCGKSRLSSFFHPFSIIQVFRVLPT